MFVHRYIPETLMEAHEELERQYNVAIKDPDFLAEVDRYRREYIGGPTPTYFAKNLTDKMGGAQIWLKREDLAHSGRRCSPSASARLVSSARPAPASTVSRPPPRVR